MTAMAVDEGSGDEDYPIDFFFRQRNLGFN